MAQSIKCGDKFVRPESPEIVWNVERIVDMPGLPQHAEIASYGLSTKKMLLSEKALLDHRMWKTYGEKAA
jgi:hypothetical protein